MVSMECLLSLHLWKLSIGPQKYNAMLMYLEYSNNIFNIHGINEILIWLWCLCLQQYRWQLLHIFEVEILTNKHAITCCWYITIDLLWSVIVARKRQINMRENKTSCMSVWLYGMEMNERQSDRTVHKMGIKLWKRYINLAWGVLITMYYTLSRYKMLVVIFMGWKGEQLLPCLWRLCGFVLIWYSFFWESVSNQM